MEYLHQQEPHVVKLQVVDGSTVNNNVSCDLAAAAKIKIYRKIRIKFTYAVYSMYW